ncbi:lactonase family protein [Paenibacillus antri]|uniref:Lactonase family protein n=1 Tax=Paenibacillus antri TaxID=2582848 RepID=A0A5R9G926_9BACL|nr:lactonase family protein [Paenibacillus antri]TLS52927.1 lactonase family protein [Paenibacillus antri]
MYLYVGSYEQASKPGIRRYRYDAESGALTYEAGFSGLENPSFLTANRAGTALYAVSETSEGEVAAFGIGPDGELRPLGRRSTGGAHPCHLTLSEDETRLFVSNYSGGSVAVFPVLADGSLGERSSLTSHEGNGPRADRQEAPHPHSVNLTPDGRHLLVPDLGIDRVAAYALEGGRFERIASIALASGDGPRHMAFHPTLPVAYVVNELSCTVAAFGTADGDPAAYAALGTVSTLPAGYALDNTCADIHVSPDGRFVYASNRGHDSLAVFKVQDEGRLEPAGFAPTNGKTPRHFAIAPDGRFVLVAAQDSDAIRVFAADAATGRLEEAHRYDSIRRPVCLTFVG